MLVERREGADCSATACDSRRTHPRVEVVVPIPFNFPNAGQLLTLLFVPFGAWLVGEPLPPASYPDAVRRGLSQLLRQGAGRAAVPDGPASAFPHDLFQLYIPTTIVTGKFDSLVTAMSLLALALIGGRGDGGLPAPASGAGCCAAAAVIVVAVAAHRASATRLLLGAMVDTSYRKDELVKGMHLPRGPMPSVGAHRAPPPRPDRGPALQRIRARGVLRVGFVPDRLPFTFVNARGDLVGFDVELAEPAGPRPRRVAARVRAVRLGPSCRGCWSKAGSTSLMSVPYVVELPAALRLLRAVPRRRDRLRGARRAPPRLRRGRAPPGARPCHHGRASRSCRRMQERMREQLRGVDATLRRAAGRRRSSSSGPRGRCRRAGRCWPKPASAWSLLHPEYSVVVPQPNPLALPVAIATRIADDDLSQARQRLAGDPEGVGRDRRGRYDYWVLGRGAEPSAQALVDPARRAGLGHVSATATPPATQDNFDEEEQAHMITKVDRVPVPRAVSPPRCWRSSSPFPRRPRRASGGGSTAAQAQYRRWIEEMKDNPRGPFVGDQVVLQGRPRAAAARTIACAGKGQGWQHGEWSERTRQLRAQGLPGGHLLAGIDADKVVADPAFPDAYAQLLVEKFLVAADDGWILPQGAVLPRRDPGRGRARGRAPCC